MARNQPRALPWLGRRPIEQGRKYIRHSFSQPADVGGNAPLVLDDWLVLDDVDGGYRVHVKASFSSCSNRAFNKSKGWYGVGLSDVPPSGNSRVEAPHKGSPWTFSPALLAYSDYRGILLR